MKNLLLINLFSLLLNLAIFAQTDSDTQVWSETTLEFPLDTNNKKVRGIIIGSLRATDNISRLSDRRVGFAVRYKAKKSLTIQPSYIFRQQKRTFGRSNRYEHRLRLDITPKKSFDKFSVENRSRIEHRFKTGGRDDDSFYRNRTKLKFTVKKKDKSEIVTPYISNETSFDVQNPSLHRNVSAVGLSKKIHVNFSTSLYYQYRRNFQSGTKHIHAIGINFKFKMN